MLKPVLFLLLTVSFSYAEMSLKDKRSWLQSFKNCENKCSELARNFLDKYGELEILSAIRLNPRATSSVLSLHSYTLYPGHRGDNVQFLNRLVRQSQLNVFAPVFTAHHWGSRPIDFENVTESDWFLDSELGLRALRALGQKVYVQGFSMGGLMAIYLASRFPNLVEGLILSAPAVMIVNNMDDGACAGKTLLIKSLAKVIVSQANPEYLEKYLNGACPLSKAILEVRSPFRNHVAINLNANSDYVASGNSYFERLEEVALLAKSIRQKTLLFITENDEAVDVKALKVFAENLPNAKTVVFKKQDGIFHINMMQNLPTENGESTSMMVRFINE